MESVLFLQSEVKDPFAIYEKMLIHNPLFYDRLNKIWGCYSYQFCDEILRSSHSLIPSIKTLASDDDRISRVYKKLARLSNGDVHPLARESATILMKVWQRPDMFSLMHQLIGEPRLPRSIDWVENIAKKLPALVVLRGFELPSFQADAILDEVETLTKVMTPITLGSEGLLVAESIDKIRSASRDMLSEIVTNNSSIDFELLFANFLGLLIQSYDAGRGMLSNGLLHFVKLEAFRWLARDQFHSFVKESARLDPAVHNTRRVMRQDFRLGNQLIKEGEQILLVLAAANRDPERFVTPHVFDLDRTLDDLSFGAGVHHCVANQFAKRLTATLLEFLQTKFKNFEILENEIFYEPRINVRLPKKITLRLS